MSCYYNQNIFFSVTLMRRINKNMALSIRLKMIHFRTKIAFRLYCSRSRNASLGFTYYGTSFVSRQRTKILSAPLFRNIGEKTSTLPQSRVRRRNP